VPEELGSLRSTRLLGNVLVLLCAALIGLSIAEPEIRPIDMAIRQLTAMKAASFHDCITSGFRSKQRSLASFVPRPLEVPASLKMPSVFFLKPPRTIEEINAAVHGPGSTIAVEALIGPAEYEQARRRQPFAIDHLEGARIICDFGLNKPEEAVYLSDATPVVLRYLWTIEAKREVLKRCSGVALYWTLRDGSGTPRIMIPLREDRLGTVVWSGVAALLHRGVLMI